MSVCITDKNGVYASAVKLLGPTKFSTPTTKPRTQDLCMMESNEHHFISNISIKYLTRCFCTGYVHIQPKAYRFKRFVFYEDTKTWSTGSAYSSTNVHTYVGLKLYMGQ